MSEALSLGSSGQDVKRLQRALNQLTQRTGVLLAGSSLPLLVEDGIFGTKTQARVQEFQTRARLKSDGIVGSFTAKSLMVGTLSSTFALKRK
ncbi:MAG: peptidoglycan-binding domain-containing protein [Polyangiaceae bacterium]